MNRLKNLSSKERKYLAAILFTAFIIKIIFAFTIKTEIRSDSLVYHTLANNIVTLGEYSFEGKPTAIIASGYPLFLSGIYYLFGTEQIYVKIIQALIELFTGLIFFYVSRFFFKTKYSLISLSVFTFLPSNLLYSQTILTEPLFGLLSCIILYFCLKEKFDKRILFLGIVWGYAILVRSSFALSVILLPIFLFIYRRQLFEGFKRKRIKRVIQYSLFFFVGVLLVISPWLIRNKITMNTFTIATQGGFTFWSGSNPDATGTWYHKIEETNPLFDIQDEAQRDREFFKLGLEYAVNNPHKFFIMGIKKLGYLFSSERMIMLYFTEGDDKVKTSTEVYRAINPFISLLINVPYLLIMLLGTWGLLMFSKKSFFLYGFIGIWMITIFMFVALARYHYVLIPFFVLGTVKLFSERKHLFKELSKIRIAGAIGLNLFLIAVWASELYLLITK
ncbi:MAG: glycosyltransferase family 39 protein [Ignavibacteria bacterium]|nr:glycosyltransferase family 39 protein [Ignavibacteria bacterium]